MRLLPTLYKKVKDDSMILFEQCTNAAIDNEEKEILNLLIFYVHKNKTNEEYYTRLNTIYKVYSPLKYEAFLRGFLPRRVQYGSMGMVLGGGVTIPNGGFGSHYNQGGNFYCSWDGKGEHAYFSLTVRAGSLKLEGGYNFNLGFERPEVKGNMTYFDTGLVLWFCGT